MATPNLTGVSIRRAFNSIWTFYFRSKTFLTGVSIGRGVKHRFLTIIDTAGNPVDAARVTLTDSAGKIWIDDLTDATGVISTQVDEIPDNPCPLSVIKKGFRGYQALVTLTAKADWTIALQAADSPSTSEIESDISQGTIETDIRQGDIRTDIITDFIESDIIN